MNIPEEDRIELIHAYELGHCVASLTTDLLAQRFLWCRELHIGNECEFCGAEYPDR